MNKLLFVLLFISNICFAQSAEDYHTNINADKYNEILNKVFSLDFIDSQNCSFFISLRFEPTGGPESQIFIVNSFNKAEIIIIKVKGQYGIRTQLYEFIEKNKIKIEDSTELSKIIEVEKTSFNISKTKANRYLKKFLKTLRKTSKDLRKRDSIKNPPLFHGTFYEILYAAHGSDITCKISDEQVGTIELTKWMNSVRLDVEKMK